MRLQASTTIETGGTPLAAVSSVAFVAGTLDLGTSVTAPIRHDVSICDRSDKVDAGEGLEFEFRMGRCRVVVLALIRPRMGPRSGTASGQRSTRSIDRSLRQIFSSTLSDQRQWATA
jgi:hypothetical protein